MDARWFAAALGAVLAASCSQVIDNGEFKPLRPQEVAALAATPVPPSKDGATASPADVKTPEPASAAAPPAAAATETATSTPSVTASALAAHEPPTARSLFATLFAPSAKSDAAEAAATAEATATPQLAATAASGAPAAAAEPPPDEVSEADLEGESEADPSKIVVPEAPLDDGQAHDFVNVYTSRPDKPEEKIAGLPGVDWNNGMIIASLGPDGDPRNLFDGEDHPFARTVPGVPHQVIQASNGLLLAWSGINVDCIKPNLLGLVRRAEGHFGHKVIITSGYRSPAHNRRVRGALHSQHLYCNALDLFMPGVSRDDLAHYFYEQPDRGGLGLYCHTKSIHIDTGRRREWRWSCTRRG